MSKDMARLVRVVRYLRWFYANAPVDAYERKQLKRQYEEAQDLNLLLSDEVES